MYQIVWSATAVNSYQQTWDFIANNWSIDIIIDLDTKVQNLLDKLSNQERLCPPLKKFAYLRKCVISKQTSLIYSIDSQNKIINIVTFVDNRMNHPF
jgi:mRNA-degrading endonuclease RelE of RelBE toxin-antitoxin system